MHSYRQIGGLAWLAAVGLFSVACATNTAGDAGAAADATATAVDAAEVAETAAVTLFQDAGINVEEVASDVAPVLDLSGDVPVVGPEVDAGNPSDAGCAEPGCNCTENKQCHSGYCIEAAAGTVCAKLCVDACPVEFKCAQVSGSGGDVIGICVPSHPRLCEPCAADSECNNVLGGAESRCVGYKDSSGSLLGSFCGNKCATGADCGAGYSCKDTVSAGGITSSQCVKTDLVCTCDARATKLSLSTVCTQASLAGTCGGKRACGAAGLSACDAPSATTEACNLKDDDCDSLTDEASAGLCSDGEACTYDNCISAECQHPPKLGTCDDSDACSSGDECTNGKCLGKAVLCDDGNPCTLDGCDKAKGCNAVAQSGAPCSDGNVCTKNDSCQGAQCLPGTATVCDDGNLCTADSCDPKLGCQTAPNKVPCSDGDVCTSDDTCKEGACTTSGKFVCADTSPCTDDSCVASTGCVFAPNSGGLCSDNNTCTEGDMCQDGGCQPGTPKACDDNNPCSTDGCVPKKGCVSFPNTLPCSDGNGCTDGDACSNGACAGGQVKPCNDGNPCTGDVCDGAKGCVSINNGDACSDNNICTVGDGCKGGSCSPGSPTDCADTNPCTSDICDPKTGCKNATNNAPCNDGNACTTDDTCVSGDCESKPMTCSDGNPCTTDSCDKAKGCVFADNTAPCDDNNACTTSDACAAKQCTGKPKTCGDLNPCTDDTCDPSGGCKYAAVNGPCNDGNSCTQGDACGNGLCKVGSTIVCSDNNVCTSDSCDPAKGCLYTNSTASCDDGSACTASDVCNLGSCKGTNGCGNNASCTGTGANQACKCDPGFVGNGKVCTQPVCPVNNAGCNGSDADHAAFTCKTLHDFATTQEGVYWIKPDGNPAFQVSCRNHEDFGGYTLIASLTRENGLMWANIPVKDGDLQPEQKLDDSRISAVWGNGGSEKRMLVRCENGGIWGSATAGNWYNSTYNGGFKSNCNFQYGATIGGWPSAGVSWYQQNGNGECLHGSGGNMSGTGTGVPCTGSMQFLIR